jgi:hypothetical protein
MSRDKDPECRGTLLRETANAILVCKNANSPQHWIPRSQIGYMRKDKLLAGTAVVFTLPEWLIEEKQCWELVP